jgi:hypothetical protein
MTLNDTGPSILVARPVAASIRAASSVRIASAETKSGMAASPATMRATRPMMAKISFFRVGS